MIAALVLAVALTQSDWESKQIGIAPSLARVETVGRRSVTWFEHDADPTWGGRAFRDSFAIASPVTGDRAGAPLLVVLHWRGGGMPGKGVDCQADAVDDKNRVFSAPDDFYVLMLDDIRDYNVLLGRTHDEYWWGATPNYAGPTVADVPRLLACETTCEKRVLDCVEWTIRRFGIERSRVYLCGNSMGGQAAEAIGLSHGEIFAAVNANVPATVWFAAARLGFVGPDGRDREDWSVERFADPPLLVDWSGVDDVWSRDREVVYRNVAKRKWAMIGLWGDYGHCGDVLDARARNDLVEKFDWLAVRKDEAYPAFTNAASDDRIPWRLGAEERVVRRMERRYHRRKDVRRRRREAMRAGQCIFSLAKHSRRRQRILHGTARRVGRRAGHAAFFAAVANHGGCDCPSHPVAASPCSAACKVAFWRQHRRGSS